MSHIHSSSVPQARVLYPISTLFYLTLLCYDNAVTEKLKHALLFKHTDIHTNPLLNMCTCTYTNILTL